MVQITSTPLPPLPRLERLENPETPRNESAASPGERPGPASAVRAPGGDSDGDSGRTLARKREILNAASRVWRRRGLRATGMRDIAAELGMAVGNLYYYFRDRDELLAFVQDDALAGLLEHGERVRRLPLRADAKLYTLIVGHVLRVNEETPGSLAHLEVEALREPFRQPLQTRRDAYEQILRELIEEGTAAGLLRPADPKVAALTVLGAINWTVRWFRPDGGKSAEEIGHEAAELLVRGLLAPGVELAIPPRLAPLEP
ncbi:MAG: TetR/AcrR family transcriptional regulator, partial [Acidobacteriota bacterium]|nr:TetR/AcrR family transcriptional regulator [Acidobacteriota bacterium]